jgi:hypothetical protein
MASQPKVFLLSLIASLLQKGSEEFNPLKQSTRASSSETPWLTSSSLKRQHPLSILSCPFSNNSTTTPTQRIYIVSSQSPFKRLILKLHQTPKAIKIMADITKDDLQVEQKASRSENKRQLMNIRS